MNTITDDQIAEIEALAKLACQYTQPDWFAPSDLSAWFAEDDAKFIGFAGPLTVRALIARLREAERDAARYRWLRDPCSGAERVVIYSRGDFGCGLMSHTMLDAAIDEAMMAAHEAAE